MSLIPTSIKDAVRSKARQFLGIEEVGNQFIHSGLIIGLGNREVVLPDGRTARAFGLQLKTQDGVWLGSLPRCDGKWSDHRRYG